MAEAARATTEKQRPLVLLEKLIATKIALMEQRSPDLVRQIGGLLDEVHDQLKEERRWKKWIAEHFPFSQRTADRWIRVHKTALAGQQARRVSDVDKGGTFNQENPRHESRAQQAWRESLGAAKARLRAVHPEKPEGSREARQRRAYVEDLALQIVSVGYRGLAAKLHPDRGGKTDDMACLTEAKTLCLRALRWMGVKEK